MKTISDRIIKDIQDRDRMGREGHAESLKVHFSVEDDTVDAYERAIDLVVYFRQEIQRQLPEWAAEPENYGLCGLCRIGSFNRKTDHSGRCANCEVNENWFRRR